MDAITWLLLAVIGLLGAGWTLFQRAKAPTAPGKSEVEQKTEDKAKKDEQAAVDKRDKAVEDAEKDATSKNDELVKNLEEGQKGLLEDNDKLTDHLKNVGREVRGGDD